MFSIPKTYYLKKKTLALLLKSMALDIILKFELMSSVGGNVHGLVENRMGLSYMKKRHILGREGAFLTYLCGERGHVNR